MLALAGETPGPTSVDEWLRRGDRPLASEAVRVVVPPATDVAGDGAVAVWLDACHTDPAALSLPGVLQVWAAVIAYSAYADTAVAWELRVLASAVATAAQRAPGATSAPATRLLPLTPATAIQAVARWRTALFSVGLLAEALGLSSTQRSGGLPLAAAWTLLSDAELYAALERGRRGGASVGAPDEAAGVRAFLAIAHASVAAIGSAAAAAAAAAVAGGPSEGVGAPPRAAAPVAVRAGPAPRGPGRAATHANPFNVLADGLDF